MENGWVKLHRKITEWEWYNDHNTTRLFIHLLLIANHKENKWQSITVKEGEILTGRISLSKQTGLSQQSVRTSLNKLKSTNEITIKSTNKYSIIIMNKWINYQIDNQQITKRATSNQPATNHKQECKNDKNEKEEREEIKTPPQSLADLVLPFKGEYSNELLNAFFDYWSEPDKNGKERWKSEKFFEISRRLATWYRRDSNKFKK